MAKQLFWLNLDPNHQTFERHKAIEEKCLKAFVAMLWWQWQSDQSLHFQIKKCRDQIPPSHTTEVGLVRIAVLYGSVSSEENVNRHHGVGCTQPVVKQHRDTGPR